MTKLFNIIENTRNRWGILVGHPSEEAVVEAPQLNCGLRFKAGSGSARALRPRTQKHESR